MVKTVFLTGATGIMGHQSLKELITLGNKVKTKILVRNSKKNQKFIKEYQEYENIEIIIGDLRNYEDVLKGVKGSDYVLHVGGMVSPMADDKPKLTKETNIGAAENIVKAVMSLPKEDQEKIKVVYIGSVAETGCRNYPTHWGRTGDPIMASIYDHYGLSKIEAERIIVESGIKNWVVLRQSGIIYPEIITQMSPIIYSVVINGVLEWATVEDSGRLMKNLVDFDLPKEFWNKYYNIGSGQEYRLTNYEFEEHVFGSMGLGSIKDYVEPHWFITKNFHGHFFSDSDILENYLHFRENLPAIDYFKRLTSQLSFLFKIPKYIPWKRLIAFFAKFFMRMIANTPELGTLSWIKNKDQKRISAFFGSYEEYQQIPQNWKDYKIEHYGTNIEEAEKYKLSHGYDESKPLSEINLSDCQEAAGFRGGKLISKSMTKGDLSTKLIWECGYCLKQFDASPNLILLGGHWCPFCYFPSERWDYDRIAKKSLFFAQVYNYNHKPEEENIYEISKIFNHKAYSEGKTNIFHNYIYSQVLLYVSYIIIFVSISIMLICL